MAQLASCAADKCIAMWDTRTYSTGGRIENAHDNQIYAVKYANDTTLISTGRDGVIKVWDMRNLRKAKSVIAADKAPQTVLQ
jgi:WD40 repeat protein